MEQKRIQVFIPVALLGTIHRQRKANRQSLSGWVCDAVLAKLAQPIEREIEAVDLEMNFSERLMAVTSRLARNPNDESAIAEVERLNAFMPDTDSTEPPLDESFMLCWSDNQLAAWIKDKFGVTPTEQQILSARAELLSRTQNAMEKQTA